MSQSGTGPRFTCALDAPGEVLISDDDFGYDATMILTGDFLPGHDVRYAEAVCEALNAAAIPAAPADYGNDGSGDV